MNLDADTARDHLEMVDRILSRADDKPVRPIPGLVIVWGVVAAAMDAGQQYAMLHHGAQAGVWLAAAALVAGVLYSIVVGTGIRRNRCAGRISRTDMLIGRTMGAVWLTVVIAAFAQPHVFAGWSGAAVWTMGAAITMLIMGFCGSRRGLAGGLILLASVLIANYAFPGAPGYVLALGFLLGYALPGVSYALRAPLVEAQ